MFGIQFIKGQPTAYLLQYRGGKVEREGLGSLSFTTGRPRRWWRCRWAAPTLESEMAENRMIFSDGIEQDSLKFNSATKAVIGIVEKKDVLVE